ncbi:unnamed protein product [Closterium sp. Yama58-4]|nr:unnamed protein product [Closterium sp. Yama58-4]
MSHSPEFREPDGSLRERYIFFAFPHVSIGESGEVGSLLRRGRGRPSSACGALIAIQTDLNEAKGTTEDPFDEEYVLLKKKVAIKVRVQMFRVPQSACGALIAIQTDLNETKRTEADPFDEEYVLLKKKVARKVTRAALAAINEDLEKLISLTVDPATADYAVITGVQIHSGNQVTGEPFRIERTCDYIAPDLMYAVAKCVSKEIPLYALVAGSYRVVGAEDGDAEPPFKVHLQLTSPEGKQLHYGERQTEGHFGFRATKAGDHTLCVWLSRWVGEVG